ncbi:hypothetical protein FGIG_00064 [Fasciola gigantica]|uniref:Uncharacterized protein n=1 Tax=Fasciola gigantica TaxID=46835 RepID=A0A504WUV6_FASGI|nr:hypothetical protein FGIG_00064 [Fasciola gigantica]
MKELSEKVDEALRDGVERGERSVNQLTRSLAMPPLAKQANRPVRQLPPSKQPPSPALPLPPQPVQEQLQRKPQQRQEEKQAKLQLSLASADVKSSATRATSSPSRNVAPVTDNNVETPRTTDTQCEANLFPLAQQLLYYGIVVFCVYKLTGWLHIRPTFGEPTEEHSFLYRLLTILFHWILGW